MTATSPASRPHPKHDIQVGRMGGKDALQAYTAVVAKQGNLRQDQMAERGALAEEAAAIFATELKGREKEWLHVPVREAISAADVTSASVGTLAGTLVLQQSLPALMFTFPMLNSMFTDFSDAPGKWQQTETTRIQITPAVNEYDATLDATGRPKGFVQVIPAQAVDVPITLTKHVGIPMIFGVQTLGSTMRNLFSEQAPMAINALGEYFVGMATALMTPANFNAYAYGGAAVTDTGCVTVSGSTTITLTATTNNYPGQEISATGIPTGARIASITDGTHAVLTQAATASATVTATFNGGKVPTAYATYAKALADFNFASIGEIDSAFDANRVPYASRNLMLNSSYYQKLRQDPTYNTFFAAIQAPGIISGSALPQLNNFVPQKAPWFPSTNNRVGFAYHPAAIALKSRLPQDFAQANAAMIPGKITTVTDPDTNLSVLLVQRVDLVGSYAENRIEVMLGAAPGDRRAGLVLTSQ